METIDQPAIRKYIAQYQQGLKDDPQDRDALLGLSICTVKLGQFDQAARFVGQLIDAHPADPSGYYYRSLCSLKGQRPRTATLATVRAAEQDLATAAELDPANGHYDALLAALRHDFYVLNGMRVPRPDPDELLAGAGTKQLSRLEMQKMLNLFKLSENPLSRRILS